MKNLSNKIYERNELLWGSQVQKILLDKHIVIFGLGGVGSYTAEALARSGIGELTVVDFDTVSTTNINRQLLALSSNVGISKTTLMKQRINEINPLIKVNIVEDFCTPDLTEKILSNQIDFVVDAIDSVKSKVELIECSIKKNIKIISSMGAGNRLDPEQLYIADISEVKIKQCVFIKNIKYKLRKRGITSGLATVASTENPVKINKQFSETTITTADGKNIDLAKFIPGSSPFVPPVAGYMMASFIIREIINSENS